ncbi:MAG: ECF transporter S component [Candidatus Brockarchaeota archaeon]|nr:ECF transporter S component [Candidatus Brockarchaeota archaeon]
MVEVKFQQPIDRVVTIGLLSSLCIVSNYAMLPLWNVKLMDTIVFVSGFLYGLHAGMAVAAISWFVYGILNPYGFSLPTLLAVITGEMLYALSGSLAKRKFSMTNGPGFLSAQNLAFGVVGLFSTLAYDVLTNAVAGWLFYGSVMYGLLTMNFPIPMGIIHEASNFFLFAFLAPVAINSVKRSGFQSALKRGRKEGLRNVI